MEQKTSQKIVKKLAEENIHVGQFAFDKDNDLVVISNYEALIPMPLLRKVMKIVERQKVSMYVTVFFGKQYIRIH